MQRGRESRQHVEYLGIDEVEDELESDVAKFSKPVPLALLVEVLDELWEGERTL